MSWVPPNLASLCPPNSTLSSCQPPMFMFLTLVAHLFSYSGDDSYPNYDTGNIDKNMTKSMSSTKILINAILKSCKSKYEL
ncbi:hypothetical protein E2986_12106 [Frieseomelitta varia]|uniref:Uncharacterized protein n=1 Tax=Frieseomelitta varia TaxID=561572 RepID=A0A833VL13_9HYME|nr:hypothetical protein E2986_12106 [Frieseomelitta varia]